MPGSGSRVDGLPQLVPLQYRLLVINGVNIPWNAYLSIQANKGKTEETVDRIKNKVKEIKA